MELDPSVLAELDKINVAEPQLDQAVLDELDAIQPDRGGATRSFDPRPLEERLSELTIEEKAKGMTVASEERDMFPFKADPEAVAASTKRLEEVRPLLDVEQAPDRNFLLEPFLGGKKEQDQKLRESLRYSDILGISPEEAYFNHKAISKEFSVPSYDAEDFLKDGITLAMGAGIIKFPMQALVDLPVFMGIGEFANGLTSAISGTEYNLGEGVNLKKYAPEDATALTKSALTIAEYVAVGGLTKMITGSKVFDNQIIQKILPPKLRLRFYAEKQDIEGFVNTLSKEARKIFERKFRKAQDSTVIDAEFWDVPPSSMDKLYVLDGKKAPIPKEIHDMVSVNPKATPSQLKALEATAKPSEMAKLDPIEIDMGRPRFEPTVSDMAPTEKVLDIAAFKGTQEKKLALAQNINRPIPDNVDVKYKGLIDAISQDIDTAYRTGKTKERRQNTIDYLERNPEAVQGMPQRVINDIFQKTPDEMTVEDLQTVDTEITKMVDRGQREYALKQRVQKAKTDAIAEEIADNISGGAPIEVVSKPKTKAVQKAKKSSFVKKADLTFMRAWSVADMLDNGQNFQGPAHDFFYNRTNNNYNNELRFVEKRKKSMQNSFDKNKVKVKDLGKEVTVRGTAFTVDEMMGVYALSQNRLASDVLENKNNIPKDMQKEISSALSPKYKKIADDIIADYASRKEPLFETTAELENRYPYAEANYVPMKQNNSNMFSSADEIALELSYNVTPSVFKGMTLERAEAAIPEGLQDGIKLGLFETWSSQMPKHEHYINQAKHVREMRDVINNPKLNTAIQQDTNKFSPEHMNYLTGFVDAVASPYHWIPREGVDNNLNRFSAFVRKNEALSVLVGNLSSVAIQAPSLLWGLHEAGPVAFGRAMVELTNPLKFVEVFKMAREKDPQLKHRLVWVEDAEIDMMGKGVATAISKKASKVGMMPQRIVDAVATTVVWYSKYLEQIKNGEEVAVREAQLAVLRTQPQGAAKDTIPIQRSGELGRWMMRYTNQLVQEWQAARHTIPSDVKSGDYFKAVLGVMTMVMSSTLVWMIRNGRVPQTEKDLKEAMLEGAEVRIPAVGKGMQQARKGYGGGVDMLSALTKTYGYAVDSDKETMNKLGIALEGAAKIFGAPTVAIKKGKEAIDKKSLEPLFVRGKKKKKSSGIDFK